MYVAYTYARQGHRSHLGIDEKYMGMSCVLPAPHRRPVEPSQARMPTSTSLYAQVKGH